MSLELGEEVRTRNIYLGVIGIGRYLKPCVKMRSSRQGVQIELSRWPSHWPLGHSNIFRGCRGGGGAGDGVVSQIGKVRNRGAV